MTAETISRREFFKRAWDRYRSWIAGTVLTGGAGGIIIERWVSIANEEDPRGELLLETVRQKPVDIQNLIDNPQEYLDTEIPILFQKGVVLLVGEEDTRRRRKLVALASSSDLNDIDRVLEEDRIIFAYLSTSGIGFNPPVEVGDIVDFIGYVRRIDNQGRHYIDQYIHGSNRDYSLIKSGQVDILVPAGLLDSVEDGIKDNQ